MSVETSGLAESYNEIQQEHYELKARVVDLDKRFKWQNKFILEAVEVLAQWLAFEDTIEYNAKTSMAEALRERTLGLMKGAVKNV